MCSRILRSELSNSSKSVVWLVRRCRATSSPWFPFQAQLPALRVPVELTALVFLPLHPLEHLSFVIARIVGRANIATWIWTVRVILFLNREMIKDLIFSGLRRRILWEWWYMSIDWHKPIVHLSTHPHWSTLWDIHSESGHDHDHDHDDGSFYDHDDIVTTG